MLSHHYRFRLLYAAQFKHYWMPSVFVMFYESPVAVAAVATNHTTELRCLTRLNNDHTNEPNNLTFTTWESQANTIEMKFTTPNTTQKFFYTSSTKDSFAHNW